MPFVVNHVMSQDIHSGIFEDILRYFREFTPGGITHVATSRPLEGAHVRHYHRCHLETRLIGPCAVTVHHDLSDPDGWLPRQTFLDRYREADLVICLNSIQQRQLAEDGLHHTCVIPHGYNEPLIKSAQARGRVKRPKFTLGIISKRYPRKFKGEAYMTDLFKRLDPDTVGFVLIGDGRSEEGTRLRSLGFEVEVFERLPYPVLIDAYRGIDALLMASSYEGGPANIPEAAGMGVPVLANPIGMVPDLIDDGQHGMYLSMNPAKDADLINRLSVDAGESFTRLVASAQCSSPNVIAWSECIRRNVARQVDLLAKSAKEMQKLVEAFQ